MTEYQYIYRKNKAHRKSKIDHVDRGKKRDVPTVYLEKNSRIQVETDRTVTPMDPTKLSTSERRTLLQRRIMELEENQRTINSIQSEIVHDKLKSTHSESSRHSKARHPDGYVSNYNGSSVRDLHLSSVGSSIPEHDIHMKDYGQYRYISGVPTNDVQNVRKAGRSYRESVLNKAERLIHARKRRESSSDDDTSRTRKRVAKKKMYVAKRSISPHSDNEFVEVPEAIESDMKSTYENVPTRIRSRKSRSDVPSAVQVNML